MLDAAEAHLRLHGFSLEFSAFVFSISLSRSLSRTTSICIRLSHAIAIAAVHVLIIILTSDPTAATTTALALAALLTVDHFPLVSLVSVVQDFAHDSFRLRVEVTRRRGKKRV